jgi:hypothetical protein
MGSNEIFDLFCTFLIRYGLTSVQDMPPPPHQKKLFRHLEFRENLRTRNHAALGSVN